MTKNKKQRSSLNEVKASVRLKLAASWASFMALYLYVDHLHLYMPDSLQNMLDGKVFVFDISQEFVFVSLVSVTIPAIMIFLSTALPASLNRWTNIILATIYIPYTLFNLVGLAWPHMYFGAFVEVALLLLIIRYAWKWPRIEISNNS